MENIVRKGEIACHKQYLLFSQCFLTHMARIFHFKCTVKCCLQYVSILTSLEFFMPLYRKIGGILFYRCQSVRLHKLNMKTTFSNYSKTNLVTKLIFGMKAHIIDTHLLVPRSRSSAKVRVRYQGHISQKMGVLGALVFDKHILFRVVMG